jgi:hypothetical protein
MNYLFLSDCLWYFGHILTASAIIFTRNNYYIAVSFVFTGQFITIISRPIGRIKNNIKVDDNIELNDIEANQSISV